MRGWFALPPIHLRFPVNQELAELEADSARGSRRFLDLPTYPT